jgi:hypothetical protein
MPLNFGISTENRMFTATYKARPHMPRLVALVFAF